MQKIEPMDVGEIRELLREHRGKDSPVRWCNTCRLCLAWIHAEARAREAEFWRFHWDEKDMGKPCWCKDKHVERHDWDSANWVAAVKREVGWVEDEG